MNYDDIMILVILICIAIMLISFVYSAVATKIQSCNMTSEKARSKTDKALKKRKKYFKKDVKDYIKCINREIILNAKLGLNEIEMNIGKRNKKELRVIALLFNSKGWIVIREKEKYIVRW